MYEIIYIICYCDNIYFLNINAKLKYIYTSSIKSDHQPIFILLLKLWRQSK